MYSIRLTLAILSSTRCLQELKIGYITPLKQNYTHPYRIPGKLEVFRIYKATPGKEQHFWIISKFLMIALYT